MLGLRVSKKLNQILYTVRLKVVVSTKALIQHVSALWTIAFFMTFIYTKAAFTKSAVIEVKLFLTQNTLWHRYVEKRSVYQFSNIHIYMQKTGTRPVFSFLISVS